jgi:Flp pilus assembly pilin Flp
VGCVNSLSAASTSRLHLFFAQICVIVIGGAPRLPDHVCVGRSRPLGRPIGGTGKMQVLWPGFSGRMSKRTEHEGERGQGLVEYGFILVLIAVFVILSVQLLGHQTNNLYSNIANGLSQ